MGSIPKVTPENFQERVLDEEKPTIVYFSTDGCGPCEAIVPVLKDLQADLKDDIYIKNVHVTFEEGMNGTNEVVTKYEIMAYPTLLVIKDGQPVKYIIGKYTKAEIMADLKKVI